MKKKSNRLTPAQWDIMQVCLREGDLTPTKVLQEAFPAMAPGTLYVLLRRIVAKGHLTLEQINGINHYSPSEDQLSTMIRKFVTEVASSSPHGLPLLIEAIEEEIGTNDLVEYLSQRPAG